MALSDKNIVITPNKGSSSDPQIVFTGASASLGPQNITLKTLSTNNGTITFEGSAGQLFSVSNTLTGTLFSVNDISGLPTLEVLDTGVVKLAQYGGRVIVGTGNDDGTSRLQVNGTISPSATNSYDLGTSSLRWRNIYTQDLHLSNGIGDYTMIEGEEELFLVNNKNGKHYKFALIEVDPSIVPPKSKTD